MNAIILKLTGIAVCALSCSAQTSQTSTISGIVSGTVKGFDGSTIASGVVTASRLPDSLVLPRDARRAATAAIRTDGTFQLPPLFDGRYQICPQVPGGWISPCEWAPGSAPSISILAGRPSQNVNIVLKPGALVSVRVNDPGQLLATSVLKSTAGLLIGVSTDSLAFRRATLVGQDAAGSRTYQVLIPFDRSIAIVAASSSFQVSDAIGRMLISSNNATHVLVSSGQQPPTVVLTVTSKFTPRVKSFIYLTEISLGWVI